MGEQLEHRSQQWLEEFLGLARLSATVSTEARTSFSGEENCWLLIDSDGLHPHQIESLIGDRGAGLDSIQYLANAALNRGVGHEEQGMVMIELNGYRESRLKELEEMAQAASDRVRETGEEYEIKSLSSAERRQIHSLLQAQPDLETFSRGQEPHRHLVVRFVQS
ncbi:protein jag [Myxacorys almedinensis]|uniref:RNA-binding protein n=1 Tax=Myxacorys almedinensis A TaxID=2690445 RepID=A0A8J8CNQ0_9CYAN|nr:R3H domain-containing nucleic acid-binding protein [Myxacorys almedinensis]NDJ18662.1 RNA-binding protein [Myxacorys almedinensis A]